MIFGNTVRKSLALAAMTVASSMAQAGPYYGLDYEAQRVAFNLAVAPVATETFETVTRGLVGLAPGASIDLFGNDGQLSQAASVSPAKGARVTSATGSGRVNTTVGGAYWVESDTDFAVQLGRDVEAFSFFGTDFGDFAGGLSIALYNDGAAVIADVFSDGQGGSLIPTFSATGALTFLGYASSTRFDEIRFSIRQKANTPADEFDIYGFDDLVVGNLRVTSPNPAPEPGSLALAGLALVAAGWARKTQRRA